MVDDGSRDDTAEVARSAGARVLPAGPAGAGNPAAARNRGAAAATGDPGRSIHRAMVRRRDVVYVPWFWRPIKWVIRAIPEWIFKRLRL